MVQIPTTLGQPRGPRAGIRPVSVNVDKGLDLQMQAVGKRAQGLRYVANGLDDVNKALEAVSLRNDKLAARDQLTAYSQQAQILLYGDGTPENPGYYNLQGQDALDQKAAYTEKLTKLQQDFAAKAPNPRVGEMFQGASTDYNLAESQNMAQWSAKQGQVAYKASSDAAIQQAFDRAAASFNSEPIIQQSLLVATNETLDQLNHMGIKDPTARQVAVNAARSKLLGGTINNALRTNGLAAAEPLYQKYKQVIDGTDRAAIEQDLQQARDAETAKAEHQAVMNRLAKEEASSNAFNAFVTQTIKNNGNIDFNAVAADPNMNGNQKEDIIGFARAMGKGEAPSQVSSGNLSKFYSKLLEPDVDTKGLLNDAMKAFTLEPGNPNKINKADFDWFKSQVDDREKQQGTNDDELLKRFFNITKPQIVYTDKISGAESGLGSALYGNFQQYVQNKINEARSKNEDWHKYVTPGNKDYLGTPANLHPYQRSMQEQMDYDFGKAGLTGDGAPVINMDDQAGLYTTPEDIKAAVDAGELSRPAAEKRLEELGFKKKPKIKGGAPMSPTKPAPTVTAPTGN